MHTRERLFHDVGKAGGPSIPAGQSYPVAAPRHAHPSAASPAPAAQPGLAGDQSQASAGSVPQASPHAGSGAMENPALARAAIDGVGHLPDPHARLHAYLDLAAKTTGANSELAYKKATETANGLDDGWRDTALAKVEAQRGQQHHASLPALGEDPRAEANRARNLQESGANNAQYQADQPAMQAFNKLVASAPTAGHLQNAYNNGQGASDLRAFELQVNEMKDLIAEVKTPVLHQQMVAKLNQTIDAAGISDPKYVHDYLKNLNDRR